MKLYSPSARLPSVSLPSTVTFLVMVSLPVVRLLVKLASAVSCALSSIFWGTTVTFTPLSVASATPLGRPASTSVTVYSPGIRLSSVAVLALPSLISMETWFA